MLVEEDVALNKLEEVERRYRFREPSEVRRFLLEHTFLIPLLVEACDTINGYFTAPHLNLELIAEPEGSDDPQLVLFVAVEQPPAQAFACLQRFDNEWWLEAIDEAKGRLCISLEFE